MQCRGVWCGVVVCGVVVCGVWCGVVVCGIQVCGVVRCKKRNVPVRALYDKLGRMLANFNVRRRNPRERDHPDLEEDAHQIINPYLIPLLDTTAYVLLSA